MVKAWESKNARRALKGTALSTMAVTLAACGGSSTTDTDTSTGTGTSTGTSTTITPVAVTTDSYLYSGGAGAQAFIAGAGVIDSMNIYGGDGADSLTLTLNDDDDGASFAMTGVETVNVRVSSAATGAVTLDVADVSDVTLWNIDRIGQNLTLDNLSDLSATFMLSDIDDASISVTLAFDAADVAGTADELLLAVDSVTATGLVTIVIAGGIEAVSLDVSGEDNFLNLSAMTAMTSLDVSGTGDITLTASVSDIDASENSGGVTWVAAAASGVSAIGGAGDDTFDVSAITAATSSDTSNVSMGSGDDTVTISLIGAAQTGFSVDGGAGDDTLVAAATTVSIASASASFTGFETFHVDVTGVVSVALTAIDVDTLEVDGAAAATVSITDQSDEAISIFAGTAALAVTVASTATSGTSETISIDLAGDAATSTATTAVGAFSLTLNDYETINLSIADATTASGATVDTGSYFVVLASTEAEALSIDLTSGVDLTLTVSATAVTSLVLSGAGDVLAIAGLATGADISATGMSGDLTMATAISGTAASDTVSVALGSGDDSIVIGSGRMIVDMGDGDDTLTINATGVADLTRRDTLAGGSGTDAINLLGLTGSIDLSVDGFETLTASVSATTGTVALDGADEIVSINAVVGGGGGSTLSITGVSATEIDIDMSAVTGTAGVSLSNSSSGTADIANVAIASTTANTASVGDITLVGFEVINLTVDVATTASAGTVVAIDVIDAASATSIVIDASGDTNSLQGITLVLGVDATVDLTDVDNGLGLATAATATTTAPTATPAWTATPPGATTTTAAAVITTTYNFLTGTAGISLSGTDVSVTFLLDDDKAAATVVTRIDLGTAQDAVDTIEIVNSSAADNIGTVVIDNFLDRTTYSVDKASIIDLSDLGIEGFSDLSLTNVYAASASGATASITITGFSGSIILIGVDAADLTAANFTFA